MEKISFIAEYSKRIAKLYQKQVLPKYFKAPIFCLWELTDRCNLSCIHCYYNSNKTDQSKEFSTSEALGIIEQLASQKVFEVYLTGGEFFLREDWESIVENLRKYNIQVGVITNGTCVDRQAALTLGRLGVKWVQISLDGATAPVHDHVRGVTGAWEKSVNAVKYLKEAGLRTHVSFVPTRYNFHEIKDAMKLCMDLGLEYFVTDMLVITGRAAINFTDVTLRPDEYEKFHSTIEEAAKEFEGKLTIIAPSREKEILSTYVSARSANPNIWCIITPQASCRLDLLLPFTYGDLRKQSLEYIWNKFLRQGWARPEAVEFMSNLGTMSDLAKAKDILYVTADYHYQ